LEKANKHQGRTIQTPDDRRKRRGIHCCREEKIVYYRMGALNGGRIPCEIFLGDLKKKGKKGRNRGEGKNWKKKSLRGSLSKIITGGTWGEEKGAEGRENRMTLLTVQPFSDGKRRGRAITKSSSFQKFAVP